MTPLLEQFLSESREFSQGIGEKLMQMEDAPSDQGLINELFRLVHTLKGNSGLFTFPEMTRVLHAGEDLLGLVRNGQIAYSRELADCLLDAIDFVMVLCADIEATEQIDASRAQDSARMAESLRALMPAAQTARSVSAANSSKPATITQDAHSAELPPLAELPKATRIEALHQCHQGETLHWICYTPASDCFFQGDDPLFSARQTPGLLWGSAKPTEPLPPLAELDTYRCVLEFHLLSAAPREELDEHFRYVPDQVRIVQVNPGWLSLSEDSSEDSSAVSAQPVPAVPEGAAGEANLISAAPLKAAAKASIEDCAEQVAALESILSAQRQILMLDDRPDWGVGRLKAAGSVLLNLANSAGDRVAASEVEAALAECLATGQNSMLLLWLEASKEHLIASCVAQPGPSAVSYTHLDVYKRQAVLRGRRVGQDGGRAGPGAGRVRTGRPGPVGAGRRSEELDRRGQERRAGGFLEMCIRDRSWSRSALTWLWHKSSCCGEPSRREGARKCCEEAEAPVSRVRLGSTMELVLGWYRSPCSLRTAKGYGDVLEQFRQRCQKGYLDEMSRADLVAFIVKKKERVLSSRTIFNRVSNVWTHSSARMGY